MQDLSSLVISVAFIYGIVWDIGVVVAALNQRADWKRRADLYARLLDKFGSSTEFIDYLQSENGRRLFEEITVEGVSPLHKLLGSERQHSRFDQCGILNSHQRLLCFSKR
jgi:hypothetical protein